MRIELTNDEVDTLDRALLTWEQEPQAPSGLSSFMVKSLATGDDQLAEVERKIAEVEAKVSAEKDRRRRMASFIRTKLFEGQKFRKSNPVANPADALD